MQALDQRPDIKGRPGLNPIRFDTTYAVDRTSFDELRRISSKLGLEVFKDYERRLRYPGYSRGHRYRVPLSSTEVHARRRVPVYYCPK